MGVTVADPYPEPVRAAVYTPDEIARMFGVERRTVTAWCRDPRRRDVLGAFKPGRDWRFRMWVVDRYMEGLESGDGRET